LRINLLPSGKGLSQSAGSPSRVFRPPFGDTASPIKSVDIPNLLKIPGDLEIGSWTQLEERFKAGEGWRPEIPSLLIPSSIMCTRKKGGIYSQFSAFHPVRSKLNNGTISLAKIRHEFPLPTAVGPHEQTSEPAGEHVPPTD